MQTEENEIAGRTFTGKRKKKNKKKPFHVIFIIDIHFCPFVVVCDSSAKQKENESPNKTDQIFIYFTEKWCHRQLVHVQRKII